MKLRVSVLLTIVVVLGSFLRLWQLGKNPPGFYSDEALYGYEAYSLLKTGRDQFGNFLPISIAGFGDYRPALYIYSTIPFIAIFGLTEFATRLPSAMFSIFTLIATFFMVRNLSRSNRAGLLATILMVLSPWSLFFGRMAHETNLVTFFIASGVFFLSRFRKCNFCIIPASLAFVASLYTYHSARVFVPLFLLAAFFIGRNQSKKKLKWMIVGGVVFGLLCIPLASEFTSGIGWSRVRGVSLWSDPGLLPRINDTRGKLQQTIGSVKAKLLINKVTVFSWELVKNYGSHFTKEFLITRGDPNGVYNTPRTGILLWSELVLIPLGLAVLWKKQRKLFWLCCTVILFGLLPDSLTRLSPSSARIHLLLPFTVLIGGVGWRYVLKKSRLAFLGIGLVTTLSSLWFWHNYLVVLPKENTRAWQLGVKEMIYKAQEFSPQYERIWISRKGWGWIHLVFHTKYDPSILQKEIKIVEINDLGFWWVRDLGKYHLEWFDQPLELSKGTLYIGTPDEFEGTKPKYIIKDQFGTQRYWFIDSVDQVPVVLPSEKNESYL